MPIISVIIPVYNAEGTILATVKSVQQQTFQDLEIIVINDGSSDNTTKLLEEIIDPRLKLFSYENAGVSIARNRGISHATGEFIAFIDADDLWTPDKLELQFQALQHHSNAGVAYSWTYFTDENGQSIHVEPHPPLFQGRVFGALLLRNFLAHGSNPLLRRAAVDSVGKFDSSIPGAADWDYYLRLAAKWEFVVVAKPQIYYRQSATSMSSKVDAMEEYQFKVIDRALLATGAEFQSLRKESYARAYQYCAELGLRCSGKAGSLKNTALRLGKAFILYPRILFETEYQNLVKWLLKKYL